MSFKALLSAVILFLLIGIVSCSDYSYPVPTDGVVESLISKNKIFETWNFESGINKTTYEDSSINENKFSLIEPDVSYHFAKPNILELRISNLVFATGTYQLVANGNVETYIFNIEGEEEKFEVISRANGKITLKDLLANKESNPGEITEITLVYNVKN